jgi:hypothetical protein
MASTRWFNLFFPPRSPPGPHRVDNSPAASLPTELLLEIFCHVATSTRAPDRDTVVYPSLDELERSSRHPLAGALLVCSCWAGPATVALYQEIGTSRVLSHISSHPFSLVFSTDLSSLQAAERFRSTITQSPAKDHLGNIVKALRLPIRANAPLPCPKGICQLFADIILACPNLVELECITAYSLVGRLGVWEPLLTQPQLLSTLHFSNTTARQGFLPYPVLRSYPNLTSLTLSAYCIGNIGDQPLPPVPSLASLSLSSCTIGDLERFLPVGAGVNLLHLELHNNSCTTNPSTITIPKHLEARLETLFDNRNHSLELSRLQHMTSLRTLHVSPERFFYAQANMPPNLEHLSLSLCNVGGELARKDIVDTVLNTMRPTFTSLHQLTVYVRGTSLWNRLTGHSTAELNKLGVELVVRKVHNFPSTYTDPDTLLSLRVRFEVEAQGLMEALPAPTDIKTPKPQSAFRWPGRRAAEAAWDNCGAAFLQAS